MQYDFHTGNSRFISPQCFFVRCQNSLSTEELGRVVLNIPPVSWEMEVRFPSSEIFFLSIITFLLGRLRPLTTKGCNLKNV